MLRKMQKKQGFTLVEIMIVVAIIIVVAAISMHSLMRARIIANEAGAMRSLKALQTALESYRAVNGSFPAQGGQGGGPGDFNALLTANPPYLDNSWYWRDGDGWKARRQGYEIWFKLVSDNGQGFLLTAHPIRSGVTGKRAFELSQSSEFTVANDGEIYTTGGVD